MAWNHTLETRMTCKWKCLSAALIVCLAGGATSAQHMAATKNDSLIPAAKFVQPTESVPAGRVRAMTSPAEAPVLRGPGLPEVVLYDSTSVCNTVTTFAAFPSKVLDDGSFAPNSPANPSGAFITEIDFPVWVAIPQTEYFVRMTVYNTITLAGQGDPLVVQSDPLLQEVYFITGTTSNTTAGAYLFTADVEDFLIPDADWGIELEYFDATGMALPNGSLAPFFPATACAAVQPMVGSNQQILWADNDMGLLMGDGILYEPFVPGGLPNQGDAVGFAAGGPDAGFSMQLRGVVNDGTIGACCLADESCVLTTQTDCDAQGGTLTLGEGCTAFFCVPAPANDDCANAEVISGFGQFAYDNRAATNSDEVDPACGAITEDIWYRWQAPCSGDVTLSTCLLTTTDDLFVVYQGTTCGTPGTEVACDDDGCGVVGGSAMATFSVNAGTTYLIRIGTFAGAPGGQNFFDLSNFNCSGGPAFCDADWCQDGSVGVPDIFCFLSDWFALDPEARNYGGTPGVPAIFAFLSEWFSTGQGPCTP